MFARQVLNQYASSILIMPAKAGMMVASLLLAGVMLFTTATASATPKIEHWTLKNGARVYFVEARNLPMVTLNVVFDAGSARDPQGRNGLSMLTNHLLDNGTGELDADAIAATFEGLGAEFGSSNDRDMAGASLRSLSDRALLDPALDLFARVLAAPSFPVASFERERRRALLGLKQAEASAGTVASKAFFAQLYKGHPYALPPDGSEAGLKALTRDDLAAFHARHYVGRNAVLALIGDIKLREAKALAERVLGGLPAGEAAPPLPKVADVAPRVRAERVLAHPSTQTHLMIGEAGMARNDPDFYPLYLGNHVLGGSGLVSRLSQEVREQRGLSYSVYSYFLPLREPGPFLLGLQTKNSQRAEALSVVRRVLKEYTEKGPTPEELAAAKKNVTGGFPLRIDSNKKIAEYLTVIGFYGLPLTYLDDFIPRIEAVTAEQIRDAFRRRVHPEHMLTVVVGGSGG
jgi:zinc protease